MLWWHGGQAIAEWPPPSPVQTVWGLRWHALPTKREGVRGGEDRPGKGRGRAFGGEKRRPLQTALHCRRHPPPPAVRLDTEKWNRASPGAPLAQPTNGKEQEGVVRGRWTPRPMGGKAKGKESREGRGGQGGRGRSQGGERPMGTTAYGGKRSKGRAANGDRPAGAASCRQEQYAMASCPRSEAKNKFVDLNSVPKIGCVHDHIPNARRMRMTDTVPPPPPPGRRKAPQHALVLSLLLRPDEAKPHPDYRLCRAACPLSVCRLR